MLELFTWLMDYSNDLALIEIKRYNCDQEFKNLMKAIKESTFISIDIVKL
jgi:hypothetical protein